MVTQSVSLPPPPDPAREHFTPDRTPRPGWSEHDQERQSQSAQGDVEGTETHCHPGPEIYCSESCSLDGIDGLRERKHLSPPHLLIRLHHIETGSEA